MKTRFYGGLAAGLLAVGPLWAKTPPPAAASESVAVVAPTAAASEILPPEAARDHIGQSVTIEGEVTGIRFLEDSDRKPVFLNFGEPFPKHTFTVVIFGKDRGKFAEPPEKQFEGKRVRVRGTIERYRGKPQIVVEDPAQIEIVPPPDAPKN